MTDLERRRNRERKRGRIALILSVSVALILILPLYPSTAGSTVSAKPLPTSLAGVSPSHGSSPAASLSSDNPTPAAYTAPFGYCQYYGWACKVYVGAAYSGSKSNVGSVQFTATIPNGTPVGDDGNDLYHVLLSIWDNFNFYDQIGITDAKEWDAGGGPFYTVWTLYYSAWSVCTSSYPSSGSATAYTLTPGDQYTFRMVDHSNGNVEFDLFAGTNYNALLWSFTTYTGGTTFVEANSAPSCVGDTNNGYTEFEELTEISAGSQPAWDFSFDNSQANGLSQSSWAPFSPYCGWIPGQSPPNPPGYPDCRALPVYQVYYDLAAYTLVSGNTVTILNQWFTNNFATNICVPNEGWCQVNIQRGTTTQVTGTVTAAPSCVQGVEGNGIAPAVCSGNPSYILLNQFPTSPVLGNVEGCNPYSVRPSAIAPCLCPTASGGWTCGFTGAKVTNTPGLPPSSAGLPFSYTFSITVPSTAPCQLNLIRFNVTQEYYNGENPTTYDWASFEFAVYVGGCGGGGCVALGTPILTATGYRQVQDLAIGERVIGYNLSDGQLVPLTLEGDHSSWVNAVEVVDRGLLVVTPTDQPVFIKNATFTGWVRDPQNLSVGDWLFNPVAGNWTFVYSIALRSAHIKVFDVVTSGVNTFIANGLLLDIKA
jgi:hypothetical protein